MSGAAAGLECARSALQSGLEQAGEQRRDGGFDPQDACAQLHWLQARLGQQVDLVGDPATLRADGQG